MIKVRRGEERRGEEMIGIALLEEQVVCFLGMPFGLIGFLIYTGYVLLFVYDWPRQEDGKSACI